MAHARRCWDGGAPVELGFLGMLVYAALTTGDLSTIDAMADALATGHDLFMQVRGRRPRTCNAPCSRRMGNAG